MKLAKKDIILLVCQGIIQGLLIFGLFLEYAAFASDRKWNKVLSGESKFSLPSNKKSSYFWNQPMFHLEQYGDEKALLHRSTIFETIFMGYLVFVFATIVVHQSLLVFWGRIRKQWLNKLGILLGYIIAGFLFMAVVALQSSSINEATSNLIEVHKLLYAKLPVKSQNYETIPTSDLNNLILLKDIEGVCIKSSALMAVSVRFKFPEKLLDRIKLSNKEELDASWLIDLGFCQKDTLKVEALVCALVAGVVCWLVPCFELHWPTTEDDDHDGHSVAASSKKHLGPGIGPAILESVTSFGNVMGIDSDVELNSPSLEESSIIIAK